MNADTYRGEWGGKHCRDSPVQTTRSCNCSPGQCVASGKYVDQLEEVLRYSAPKGRVGGFFAESIQVGNYFLVKCSSSRIIDNFFYII
jgi:alanine-glyoxylate transaminase/(R)-3-amino-2-methylpropionate-pyruvate transaminase